MPSLSKCGQYMWLWFIIVKNKIKTKFNTWNDAYFSGRGYLSSFKSFKVPGKHQVWCISYILVSYAMLFKWYTSLVTCIFLVYTQVFRWVYTCSHQENTSDKWDVLWYTTRECCITILYHTIENAVANTINAFYTCTHGSWWEGWM